MTGVHECRSAPVAALSALWSRSASVGSSGAAPGGGWRAPAASRAPTLVPWASSRSERPLAARGGEGTSECPHPKWPLRWLELRARAQMGGPHWLAAVTVLLLAYLHYEDMRTLLSDSPLLKETWNQLYVRRYDASRHDGSSCIAASACAMRRSPAGQSAITSPYRLAGWRKSTSDSGASVCERR